MVSRGLFFAALLAMCGTAQAVIETHTSDNAAPTMPVNLPAALNTAIHNAVGVLPVDTPQNGVSDNNADNVVRLSTNTIKMYVKPVFSAGTGAFAGQWDDANYDSTATMYYSINDGATVTIGTYTTTQAAASMPFIFLDNMEDGTSYNIKVWTVLNAKSNTKVVGANAVGTVPSAADVAAQNTNAAAPLTLKIFVQTSAPVSTVTTTMAAYSNAATGTIRTTCSKAATAVGDPAGGKIEFWVSFAGSAYAVPAGGSITTAGVNYYDYSYSLAGKTDGSYTFSVYCKFLGYAQNDATLVTGVSETTNPKPSLTWFYDTTAPVVAVQAGPGVGGAASLFAYGAGTTSFTFSCTDENGLACTYKCALDGKATSNGASTSTASKGYYSCTSGHTITLAAGVTTTFHVYAVDLAGNESPLSPMYAYSNDNTAPLVAFGKADTGAGIGATGAYTDVVTLATEATNADESFGGYYPTTIDAANGEYLKDGSTAVKTYLQSTPTVTQVANPIDGLNVVTAATTTSQATYRTVLQVAMDNTDPVYDLTSNGSRGVTDGYGVLLAAREVNAAKVGTLDYGVYTYNVLLSTNSPGGKLDFVCIHNEMLNGDSIGDIITAA